MIEFISQNVNFDYFLRLLASLFCGLCFGIERKIRQNTVGMRTLILICMSSCLLSILSVYMAEVFNVTGDPTRIAAGIITGIGFLGAGAIFHQGLNIRGLTTAAIVFTDSALGISCGAGLYIPSALVLVISIITLVLISKAEKRFFPAEKRKNLEITIKTKNFDENKIKETVTSCGIIIHDVDIKYSYEEKRVKLIYSVHSPDSLNSNELISKLIKIDGITNLELTNS